MGNLMRHRQGAINGLVPLGQRHIIPNRRFPAWGVIAPLWESVPNPPDGQQAVAYPGHDLAGDVNAAPDVVYTIDSGVLPLGLSLVGSQIQGTPTAAGAGTPVTILATNVAGSAVSASFTIDVTV